MENRLSELFPIQSIGPLIGGALIWFAINYLYLGPELIGPRLAAKYYMPACIAAVAEGREEYQNKTTSLRQAFAQSQEELARTMRQTMQQGVGGMFGTMLGGRPGSDKFFRKHGDTVQGWTNSLTDMASPAIADRLQSEQRAFEARMAEREKDARRGVIYPAPAQFCGCVVTEGLKERVDLAAFTATLRLYTPPAIRRLADGTMLHDARACGTVPSV